MGRKLYIADWHYGHGNALHFDNRPFRSVEEMNAALVSRWNQAVHPEDTVFVLGDMFWKEGDATAALESLVGQKVLIRGNHDRLKVPGVQKLFDGIHSYLEIEDCGRSVVLCHYPIPCFRNHFFGAYHLYGHVHNSFEAQMMEHDRFLMETLYNKPCNMFNVGAMMPYMDYTPRTLDEIVAACPIQMATSLAAPEEREEA